MNARYAPPVRAARRARGFTLYESLIALAIGAFGLLSAVRLGVGMQNASDVARQVNEATAIGQSTLDQLRAYQQIGSASAAQVAAGQWGYGNIASGSKVVEGTNAEYTVTWNVAAGTIGKPTALTVAWTGRRGTARSIAMSTMYSGSNPASEIGLTLTPSGNPIRNPKDRSLNIPVPATDLGDGTSAFTPPGADPSFHLVFSNATGVITRFCTGAGTTGWSCTNQTAYLVTGFIGYSSKAKPAFTGPAVTMTLTQGSLYTCYDDSALATPLYAGYYTYTCVVFPNTGVTPPAWSGSLNVSGIAFGTTSSTFKSCRYSADYDGSGTIDNNEHPAAYANVTSSLENQNFYVTPGNSDCPTGTVQHQP